MIQIYIYHGKLHLNLSMANYTLTYHGKLSLFNYFIYYILFNFLLLYFIYYYFFIIIIYIMSFPSRTDFDNLKKSLPVTYQTRGNYALKTDLASNIAAALAKVNASLAPYALKKDLPVVPANVATKADLTGYAKIAATNEFISPQLFKSGVKIPNTAGVSELNGPVKINNATIGNLNVTNISAASIYGYQTAGNYVLSSEYNELKDSLSKTYQTAGNYALKSDLDTYKVSNTFSNLKITGTSDFVSLATFGSGFNSKGVSNVDSELNVGKVLNANDVLNVTGALNAKDNLNVDKVLNVTGESVLNLGVRTGSLNVTGGSTLVNVTATNVSTGTLNASGALNVTGISEFSAQATFKSGFNSNVESNVNAILNVGGALNAKGGLTVTGGSTLSGLNVTSALNAKDNLNLTGSLNVTGGSTLANVTATNVSTGTLNVNGASQFTSQATFKNGFNSNGDSTVSAILNVGGALNAKGGLTVTGNIDHDTSIKNKLYNPPDDGTFIQGLSDWQQIQMNAKNGGYLDFALKGEDSRGRFMYDNNEQQFKFYTAGDTDNVKMRLDKDGTLTTNNLTVKGMDFVLGNGNKERGDSGPSRALVKDGGNVLHINYARDFDGGIAFNGNQMRLDKDGTLYVNKIVVGETVIQNKQISMGNHTIDAGEYDRLKIHADVGSRATYSFNRTNTDQPGWNATFDAPTVRAGGLLKIANHVIDGTDYNKLKVNADNQQYIFNSQQGDNANLLQVPRMKIGNHIIWPDNNKLVISAREWNGNNGQDYEFHKKDGAWWGGKFRIPDRYTSP